MPKFSIIIPLYNTERYIGQCLDSLLEQTFHDFEVIIIDDGSTDNSAQMVKNKVEHDARFHYYHKENGGVSSARNLGIDKASGEWISFVDADDWLSKDYLQTFVDTNPKADITFFGATLVKNDVIIEHRVHSSCLCNKRGEIEKAIYNLRCGHLGDVFGWTWDKFFCTRIIKEYNVRFLEDVSFREDELFTLEYCRYVKTLRIVEKSLYYYRILDSGLTKCGMRAKDLIPSAISIENSLVSYSHPALREHLLASITNYRAKSIYTSSLSQIKRKLYDYQKFIVQNPQPGVCCKVNNLSLYLNKGFWFGYLYCLIRKI